MDIKYHNGKKHLFVTGYSINCIEAYEYHLLEDPFSPIVIESKNDIDILMLALRGKDGAYRFTLSEQIFNKIFEEIDK